MCNFFSLVTDPDNNTRKLYYFDWNHRSKTLHEHRHHDSHSSICAYFSLDEDQCNKYEYNPLTKAFKVDQINADYDDRLYVQERLENLDFKKIVEPLVVKEIVCPLQLPKVSSVTEDHIKMLKDWASVRASVRDSVRASVRDSVWDSVGDSVWASVWASVRDSVWAYVSSFFDIDYEYDFSSFINLWHDGLIPSFDGKTWRLHSGKNADIVFKSEVN